MTDNRFMTASGIVVVWPGSQRTVRCNITKLVGWFVKRRQSNRTASSGGRC